MRKIPLFYINGVLSALLLFSTAALHAGVIVKNDAGATNSLGLDNAALEGTARMTTVGWGATPNRIHDGNTSGTFNENSVIHTHNAPNADGMMWVEDADAPAGTDDNNQAVAEGTAKKVDWPDEDVTGRQFVEIDLGVPVNIYEIVVFNRTDCCQDRASNYRLSIRTGNTEVWGQDFPDAIGADRAVLDDSGAALSIGQVVRLELLADPPGIINIAEIEVYAQNSADLDPILVAPADTGLGQISAFPASASGSYQIVNQGASQDLVIDNIAIENDPNGHFSLQNASFPITIAPGGQHTLNFGFDRKDAQGGFSANFVYDSNDTWNNVTQTRVTAAVLNQAGPIAHYELDEANADSGAFDRSGFGRNGTFELHNAGSLEFSQPGLTASTGTAVGFADGAHVAVPAGSFDGLSSFSILAWVSLNTETGIQTIAGQLGSAAVPDWLLTTVGKNLALFAGEGDTPDYQTASDPLSQGTAHHVAMTYGTGTGETKLTMYVDGVSVLEEDLTATPLEQSGPGGLALGALFGPLPLDGLLDDFQIYNRALSAEDVVFLKENPGQTLGMGGDIDSDGDGLTDEREVTETETEPLIADTDGDGINDGAEVDVVMSNPKNEDSDGDGIPDKAELDAMGAEAVTSADIQPEKVGWATVFTGGDPGEGLDFSGTFLYAVDVRGPGGYSIGDAEVTGDAGKGVSVVAQNEILNWGGINEFGDSPNDNNLEAMLHGIRWSNSADDPTGVTIELKVPAQALGTRVKLQLLFAEKCCDRGWDIIIDDELVADDFSSAAFQGGLNVLSNGTVYSYVFAPEGDTVNIVLDGTDSDFPDTNAIINGLTLEQVSFGDDSDGDGLFDNWESAFFGDITSQNGGGDPDGDGLDNTGELTAGSDPTEPDSDGDTVNDGDEIADNTDPNNADTDGDGLDDGVETNTGSFVSGTDTGTDPTKTDTDGDGFSDYAEVLFKSDPTGQGSTPLTDPNAEILLACWDFNDATDPAVAPGFGGINGSLEGDAAYTDDAEGRSGQAGDRALDLGAADDSSHVFVESDLFRVTGETNQVTLAFWQKLTEVSNMTTFKARSPSSSGNERGLSVHTPWSNNNIYFDTAGCCGGGQRINKASPIDFTEWHHFVFVKNGDAKEIWVDGVLFHSGTNVDPLPKDFEDFTIGSAIGGAESMAGVLDDVAVFGLALNEDAIVKLASGASPKRPLGFDDEDGDGLDDFWEETHFGDITSEDGAGDPDSDGLTNSEEFSNDTLPAMADTDGDGLQDGPEVNTHSTDPLVADSDSDGLTDGEEVNAENCLDPNNRDSDGDGLNDGYEMDNGSDPCVSGEVSLPDPLVAWTFNNGSDGDNVPDDFAGIIGVLQGGAQVVDTGGVSGGALDITAGTALLVEEANIGFFNDAIAADGENDSLTVVFWQKLTAVGSQTTFKARSTSSSGSERGWSVHTPWGGDPGTIFFDTAGCCDAATQRINNASPDGIVWEDWNHFAFVKNGDIKEIWVNGVLLLSGENTAPLPTDFTQLWIGSAIDGAETTVGFLDDVAIYDSALPGGLVELLAGGDIPVGEKPVGGGDAPTITGSPVWNADGTLTLPITGAPDTTFDIQYSPDLINWSSVATGLSGSVDWMETDAGRLGNPQGFYRGVTK